MAGYLNPGARTPQVPSWLGPILPTNKNLGTPIAVLDPNATPNIQTPGPIFPSPSTYQAALISQFDMLFQTQPGERIWLPTYGLNLQALIFEVLDTLTTNAAETAISTAISTFFYPAVSILQLNVIPDKNSNQVTFQVAVRVIGGTPNDVVSYKTTITPTA